VPRNKSHDYSRIKGKVGKKGKCKICGHTRPLDIDRKCRKCLITFEKIDERAASVRGIRSDMELFDIPLNTSNNLEDI